MYLLLTDVLACPECGPDNGLVLLSEKVQDRRVLEGQLGCPACERRYPVRGGFADFAPERVGEEALEQEGLEEAPLRVAALMGVAEGPASVLVCGASPQLAAAVAGLVPRLEVALTDSRADAEPEEPGVSRMRTGRHLPFYGASLRAVTLFGATAARRLEEAVRVLHPTGRLVIMGAEPPTESELARHGLQLLAREGQTAVLKRR